MFYLAVLLEILSSEEARILDDGGSAEGTVPSLLQTGDGVAKSSSRLPPLIRLGFLEQTGSFDAFEKLRQRRRERGAFVGPGYHTVPSPVPCCLASARGV